MNRGRPRDGSRDLAIHEATLALLAEVGYDRLSIGAVADRAGVGKATIYRRFAGKAEVVAAAVESRPSAALPEPTGASLREDLLAVLRWLGDQIAGQDVGIIAAVLAGMRSDPELAAAMRDRLSRDQAAMLESALGRATARAEPLRDGAAQLFAEVAPAVVVHRLLIVGEPCDAPFLERVVDDVLMPLLVTC